MPLIRIEALDADSKTLELLGRAVHEAVVDAIGVPSNDHFQVLISHGGERSILRYDDYLNVPRDSGIVYIAITMRAGRSADQKKALYERIALLANRYAGTDSKNIFITLYENQSIDWSLGYGIAQYVEPPALETQLASAPPRGVA